MSEEDVFIDSSKYSGIMKDKAGEIFDVQIYKADFEEIWTLEVVDQAGTSFVWDEKFQTDKLAYEEAVEAMNEGERFDKGLSSAEVH